MHLSLLLGAGALLVVGGVLGLRSRPDAAPVAAAAIAPASRPASPASPQAPPQDPPAQDADGHYVLVVEGDRNALDITFARKKAAPWGGVAKGLQSAWTLVVRDRDGRELATVPLDVSPFRTGADAVGQPARVHGCIVREARIGMLVNVPRFARAHGYELRRPGANDQPEVVGTVTGRRVRELAEDLR